MFLCTGQVFLIMFFRVLCRIWPFYFSNLNLQWKLKPSRLKPQSLKGQKMKTGSINVILLSREFLPRKKNNFIFQKLLALKKQFTQLALIRVKDSFIRMIVTQLGFSISVYSLRFILNPQLSVSTKPKFLYKELCL